MRRRVAVVWLAALAAGVALLPTGHARASGPGLWLPATSSVSMFSGFPTATLLGASGKVLVLGGTNAVPSTAAEIYEPASDSWTPAAPLPFSRAFHTATLLPSGNVLVAGNSYVGGAESLYHPLTNTWSEASHMSVVRVVISATLLPDGTVLVAGGQDQLGHAQATAERYDYVANTWSSTGSMAGARWGHTATLLPNGKVLVAGGFGPASTAIASAELYDPASGSWSSAGVMAHPHGFAAAALLQNGKVLVMGGVGSVVREDSAELYDPIANTWSSAGTMALPRSYLTATTLGDGSVLVTGGSDCCSLLTETEFYDVETNAYSPGPPLNQGRQASAATLLLDGRVLVLGGTEDATAEIYTPDAVLRDHKTDANGDGYSTADEETITNCGVASCSRIIVLGTGETRTCKDAGRDCGSPGAPADEGVAARVAVPPADGYGCDVTLDTVGPKTTTKLAQSDIDLDGAVSILDLSKVASWFGNAVNVSPADPRWEGDLDGDRSITILDLYAMAANFYRSVAGNCLIE